MQDGRMTKWSIFWLGSIVGGLIVLSGTYFKPERKDNKALFSQYYGYRLWEEKKGEYDLYDLDEVIYGMKKSAADEKPPLDLSKQEQWQMADELERAAFEKLTFENLQKAERFLGQIAKRPGVVCIEEKKLYFEILSPGKGSHIVEPKSSCLFTYTICSLGGKSLDASAEPRQLDLSEVIPGFAKGVVGMRQGEKRALYIHPDLGYGASDWFCPPESLLIITVDAL